MGGEIIPILSFQTVQERCCLGVKKRNQLLTQRLWASPQLKAGAGLEEMSAHKSKPVMLEPLHGSAWAWQICVSCSSSSPKINYRFAVCCRKAGGKGNLELSYVPLTAGTHRKATCISLKYFPHSERTGECLIDKPGTNHMSVFL